ncbi:aldehyde dehydrogenase family protein [Frankia sp. CNm7]|uniref:aldehyde dehydrogenase (NAD(+)) n=1 Tax=Frankia nepalensis TaxID=1836974 RepID=A0A937RDT5_9ACTN|nr:aldehyde dehydrogenase family protein [Frankia nepalensis]MBL7500895.1 aldehyde dehydrogenase family protein [Frankia nepalensis]MBL7510324.1 aldehyde dehydrogenase family protein [Frankia nepalensis]MBL7518512.1 aldehyde dehydrogenase family protein [Frankia nepalensis]MBL7625614.1 aldehyde dehydrogenase family protein [Frankia nepalensis]
MGVPSSRIYVAGEWVEPAEGHYPVVNPATEEVIGEAPEASAAQAEQAAAAARAAFSGWASASQAHRAEVLGRIADLLTKYNDDLVPLVQAETGATMRVASTMQVPVAVERFQRYARHAMDSPLVPLPPQAIEATPLAKGGVVGAVARRAPVGVVACITPYNFPLVNLAGKVAPALAMGNTVVIKPAPQDPLQVLRFVEIAHEAGVPAGVVNVVTGSSPATGAALVASPEVDMVSFTGSTAVGRRIGEVAGRDLKRQLMELGGKGAAIVLEDADLDTAAAGIGSTWAFHSGQICTAPTRVLVHRSRHDQLVEKLVAYAGFCKVGDPLEPTTVVGPLISAAQRDRVESLVAEGVAAGATLACGGERPELERGFYAAPTLLTGVTTDMTVAQEEFFGPVVVVLTFDGDDEAVALANSTPFGLYDYVFSADTGRAYRLASRLRSGNVGLNTVARNHETPFGGFKHSGVGRDCGVFALHAYSELQSVVWPG